ncbi:hypothetical protein KSF78_0008976 [Schistosoma japonicum]|nr:hypothetical protein KSF78_0008976 [Schistosoma japonicum]
MFTYFIIALLLLQSFAATDTNGNSSTSTNTSQYADIFNKIDLIFTVSVSTLNSNQVVQQVQVTESMMNVDYEVTSSSSCLK